MYNMKKMLSLLILAGCSMVATRVAAQEAPVEDTKREAATESIFKTAVDLNVGTQGLGLEFKMPVLPRVNVRAGGNFLLLKMNQNRVFGSEPARMKMETNFHNVHALADVQPFAGAGNIFRKFIVTAGAAYFMQAEGSFTFKPTDVYYYGDIRFEPEEVGQVDADVNWNKIAPYLGAGFTDLFFDNKFRMNIGVGVYHFNSPEVKMTGTDMVADNAANQATLQRNLKDYRWLPALQIGLSYTLNSKR